MWADAMPDRSITAEDFAMLERFRLDRAAARYSSARISAISRCCGRSATCGGLKVNALVFTRHSPKLITSSPP